MLYLIYTKIHFLSKISVELRQIVQIMKRRGFGV